MTDITGDFKAILQARKKAGKFANTASGSSSVINDTQHNVLKSGKRRDARHDVNDPYLKEGYRLLDQIIQLHYFLTRAQKYYLNIATASGLSHLGHDDERHAAAAGASGGVLGALLKSLPKHRAFTESEREAMDTQVQGVVAGLFERTAALAKIAEQPPPKSSAPAGLAALFGGESDEMARHKREHYQQQQHRQAIVWLLQKRLLDASHVQKHMQERLLRQRLQKQETFLYSSAPATQPPRRPKPASTATPFLPFNLSLSALPSSLSASITSSALSLTSSGRGSARGNKPPSSLAYPPGKSDPMATSSAELLHQQQQQQHQLPPEEDVAAILTPREKMMLENANAEMLETLESSLDQVRRTTNVLQEISTLHGRLAYELQTQATTIDALYEEAWKTTDTVQRGNAQLVSAQRRFGAARIWVLLFLVTASVVLWFLDYYS